MTVRFSTHSGHGGGGGGDPEPIPPTAEFDDTIGMNETARPKVKLPNNSNFALYNRFGAAKPSGIDTVAVADSLVPTLSVVALDTQAHKDKLRMLVESEINGDSYTDETLATTNFGTATVLRITSNGAVTTGRDAYFKFDFTKFTGMEVDTDNMITFIFNANAPPLSAPTLSVASLVQAADPWDESTITWNNAPAHGVDDGTVGIAAGSDTYEHPLDTTRVGTVLGNWLSIRLRNANALDLNEVQVQSQEAAANHPMIRFRAKRGT